MSALRTLPSRPSLEYEQKEAKAFIRLLKAGDVEALARAREVHPGIDRSLPADLKLADAQLVVAREYGFASWPKMARYLHDLDQLRQGRRVSRVSTAGRAEYDARALIREHAARRVWAGRCLAAYVPRFYGLPVAEVYELSVSEDEARLAVARQHGYASWEDYLAAPTDMGDSLVRHPAAMLVDDAIARADLDRLKAIATKHPEILLSSMANGWRIMSKVLWCEQGQGGREAMRPIIEWLATKGLEVQPELDLQLCGRMGFPVDEVQRLLARGANPNWAAPNGIPVLEHALLVYWNGAAVDVLAAQTKPRRALWIAAGLGNVEGVRRSLDAKGKPLLEAVQLRPPFDAVGAASLASHPEPDDEELLLEALFVAMTNGRTNVIEYLASRGAPLNSLVFQNSLLSVAVGNGWVPIVEALLKGGADPDLRGWTPDATPREIAHEMATSMPNDPKRRRIAELF